MKTCKKVIALMLSFLMIFGAVSVSAFAESETEVPEGYIGVYTKDDL